ncbi:unnamed protein product, partial [Polarella glacialis]
VSWVMKRCWPRVRVGAPPLVSQSLPTAPLLCRTRGFVFADVVKCPMEDMQSLAKSTTRQDVFQAPSSITLFQAQQQTTSSEAGVSSTNNNSTRSFVQINISHALSDGFSIYPLLADLGAFYAEERERGSAVENSAGVSGGPPQEQDSHALQLLEKRLFDSFDGRMQQPERQSLRGQLFSHRGYGYIHDVRLGPSVAAVCSRLCEQFNLSMDALLIGLTACALARADQTTQVAMTLYTVSRDGPGESALIGLFADWRDVVFDFGLGGSCHDNNNHSNSNSNSSWGGLSVCGALLEVGEKIRRRDWQCFDGLKNPSATLVNLVTFDERPVQGFNRCQRAAGDFFPRVHKGSDRGDRKMMRPRRLVWERNKLEEWFLGMDMDERLYDGWWARRFVSALQQSLWDLQLQPSKPLLLSKEACGSSSSGGS